MTKPETDGLCRLCNHGLEHHPKAGPCQGGRIRTKGACPCQGFRIRDPKVKPLKVGDRVLFYEEPRSWYRVRAASTSGRYAVLTRPFNLQRTVFYTIVDFKTEVRGPEDLVFGKGAETDEECQQMLERVVKGESEISRRNMVDLHIHEVRPAAR